ncbi:MAG: acetyl esterase, partial [Chloroflexota bacterium]|nr:acetyl esterase [Chloroflexota bacterium]
HDLPVDEAREHTRILAELAGQGPEVAAVDDRTIPGPAGEIPVRVYTPAGEPLFPVLVFFHGGGHTVGDLDTHDVVCRALCAGAGYVVVSVDYRRGPEHRFPAAVDDAISATTWVARHAAEIGADPARLGVAGDSAGGNLATVTCIQARDRGGPAIGLQLLVYPVTDFATHLREAERTQSCRDYAEGYFHEDPTMRWYAENYLASEADIENPLASPLRADDLTGLPRALVLTAEYDPLRDEGEAYAHRLEAAGVPTTLRRYDGLTHAFFSMVMVFDSAGRALEETTAWLRAGW